MKIHIASDLHLEFSDIDLQPGDADVVVLAGDIHEGADGVEWAKARFAQPVIYVAGNHEYYNGEIGAVNAAMRAAAEGSNVHLLDQGVVALGDVRFLGVPLWTDFMLYGEATRATAFELCLRFMPDFKIITNGAGTLTPEATIGMHRKARDWLVRELEAEWNGPTVVVTHHAPHPQSVAERWADDPVSAAFVSDLEAEIERTRPALWIHGHTHTSFDYRVGATRVVCNPRGYARKPDAHRENPEFDRAFTVAV